MARRVSLRRAAVSATRRRAAFYPNLRPHYMSSIKSERGPCAEPYRPGRGALPTRAGRPGPELQPVSRSGWRGWPCRPDASMDHHWLRGGADRAAQHLQVRCPSSALGHRQDRARPEPASAAGRGGTPAHGEAPRLAPGIGRRTASRNSSACSRPRPGRPPIRGITRSAGAKPGGGGGALGQPRHDCRRAAAEPTSGDLEIDLTERSWTPSSVAPTSRGHPGLSSTRDAGHPSDTCPPSCAGLPQLSQNGRPADRASGPACRICQPCCRPASPTAERSSLLPDPTALDRWPAGLRPARPGRAPKRSSSPPIPERPSTRRAGTATPTSCQAYREGGLDIPRRAPIHPTTSSSPAPEAERRGCRRLLRSRYRAGHPGRARLQRAMPSSARAGPTSWSADELGRKPSSLSPAATPHQESPHLPRQRGLVRLHRPRTSPRFLRAPAHLTSAPTALYRHLASTLDDDRKSHRPPPPQDSTVSSSVPRDP